MSWYEATAYAAFAGRSLPTMHHWYKAAALGRFADILTVSNFDGHGPAAVGSHDGLGPFGTYDMAGNVKEWCSTDVGGRAHCSAARGTSRATCSPLRRASSVRTRAALSASAWPRTTRRCRRRSPGRCAWMPSSGTAGGWPRSATRSSP